MEIRISQEQGRVPVTVFHVSGKVDVTNYQQFEGTVRQAVAAGTRDLVIDLAEVPYISSSGLEALHRIAVMLRGESGAKSPHLKLVGPAPQVREVLRLVGYDLYIDIHPSLADAVAAF